jgi:mannose-1-phosphate guanylyltransferase / mannose-6-phosphate isomerase
VEHKGNMKLIPTILCGGAGSRLWPVSRELHPKPFIRLADGQSLLQKAYLRAMSLPDVVEVLTLTNRDLVFKTEDEYRETDQQALETAFILEPFGRNTAAAVAAAATYVANRHGRDAVLVVLPADHLIADESGFVTAVQEALKLAENGKLVTFGVTPTTPETGYGYIESNGQQVVRFVEKPDRERAEEYLKSGRFLWNSGIFCFTAGAMLDELRRYREDILRAVEHAVDQGRQTRGERHTQLLLSAADFEKVPEDSIDYAVFEKTSNAAVVSCSIGWTDIGSWSAMGELSEPDAQGNRVEGEALLRDVRNCYIRGEERLIGAVGVNDLIVIDTSDALLIVSKSAAQEVKHLYSILKSKGHAAHKLHRTVHRPWGTYTTLGEGPRFKIKRIEVRPGGKLSLQMHHHRSEHWVVVSGIGKVKNGEREMLLNTNESTYIPAGHVHRLENPGLVDLVMIEVQSGEYLGEDDIVRFDDTYGRT